MDGRVLEIFEIGPDGEYDPRQENGVANCLEEDFRPSSVWLRFSIFDQFCSITKRLELKE